MADMIIGSTRYSSVSIGIRVRGGYWWGGRNNVEWGKVRNSVIVIFTAAVCIDVT